MSTKITAPKKMNRDMVMAFYLILVIVGAIIGFAVGAKAGKKGKMMGGNPLVPSAMGAGVGALVSVVLYQVVKSKIAAY
jgi:hypothetical protein